jgi:uncharacterized phage protein (TIGR02220 family)
MTGWIKLHRSIKDNWIYDNPDYLKAWITILMEVNHKGNKVLIGSELVDCPRGSSLNSLSTWANKFGNNWTVRKVRTFFQLLGNDEMIDTQGLRKTTRLSVCKYGTYQDQCHTDDTQNDKQTTHKRHTNDNKQEGKELKNEKEVINYLNEKSGKSFKVAKGLKARFAQGYSVEDCKRVIDIKVAEWSNSDMAQYIRPQTLFSEKFDGYLNQEKKTTFKDYRYIADIDVYADKENMKVYDSAGNISKEYRYEKNGPVTAVVPV